MTLSDKLNAPTARNTINKAPSEFTPRIEIGDKSALIVTKPSTSLGPKADSYSADFDRIIRDNGLDPEAWTVVTFRRATWQVFDGSWLESFRCTLAPRGGADGLGPYPDLDDLHRAASRPRRAVPRPATDERALIVSLADVQAGKVDLRGGTEELLERLEVVRAALKAHIKKVKPSEIILLDAGDAIENFESVSSQDRTNDLQLTEQIRVWRRVLWSFVETAAASAAKVTVAGVGSNHCRVRRGKGPMGTPSDVFGVEVIAQVADIAAAYPEKYGHVSFHTPDRHDESLTVPLPAGKVLGLVHGHQVRNPNGIAAWWAGQALGRTPVGSADYLVTGHFHHLRIEPTGNGRWWFQSPTIDSGSSWYRNATGVESDPGVLTFVVEGDGSWSNLAIL